MEIAPHLARWKLDSDSWRLDAISRNESCASGSQQAERSQGRAAWAHVEVSVTFLYAMWSLHNLGVPGFRSGQNPFCAEPLLRVRFSEQDEVELQKLARLSCAFKCRAPVSTSVCSRNRLMTAPTSSTTRLRQGWSSAILFIASDTKHSKRSLQLSGNRLASFLDVACGYGSVQYLSCLDSRCSCLLAWIRALLQVSPRTTGLA